jgi:hypothetical protein
MTNKLENNPNLACELIASFANNLRFLRKFVSQGFHYSTAENPVSGSGKLDATGCLPYPHPLIIRVIFQKRE